MSERECIRARFSFIECRRFYGVWGRRYKVETTDSRIRSAPPVVVEVQNLAIRIQEIQIGVKIVGTEGDSDPFVCRT